MAFCSGDSGSGVAVNNILVGVHSAGYGCAEGKPDIHTDVVQYLEWIKFHIKYTTWDSFRCESPLKMSLKPLMKSDIKICVFNVFKLVKEEQILRNKWKSKLNER